MSTNQVPDIGEMYDWWKIKEALLTDLKFNRSDFIINPNRLFNNLDYWINKIESLGKKDKES